MDRLDQSDSTGGSRAKEKGKDEESKEEADALPDMQFGPHSGGSEELHKSRSVVVNNFRSTLGKNEQVAGSLAVEDTEGETPSLRLGSSAPENPFMSVKAVSFTPSFQPSPGLGSGKLQEPHSSTLPTKGSQALQNRFSGHTSHDNFNAPGNPRSFHASQGGRSPLQNNFLGQSFDLPRLNSTVAGSSDAPLVEMHQSSNPFTPSASKL